jgi:hypothetical protein
MGNPVIEGKGLYGLLELSIRVIGGIGLHGQFELSTD